MTGRVTIAGLGPAGPDLMTVGTAAAIESADVVRLRTKRHPAAVGIDAPSYDGLYETAETFDDVYDGIVSDLIELSRSDDVLYLVPGSPVVAEATVDQLLGDDRVVCSVIPAMSFLDLAWVRLGLDPVEAGVRLIDGHRFAIEAAGHSGPFLVAQCSDRSVLSDVKLALDEGPSTATILHHLGLADERMETVAWSEIDRELEADHLTSLYIPRVGSPVSAEIVRLEGVVRRLRSECPWDREQTHESLVPFLIEESNESVEALEGLIAATEDDLGAAYDHVEEELGDLLFQIVIHSLLASEQGQFTLSDVARGIHDKMVRRHPQIFDPSASGQPVKSWDELKADERRGRLDPDAGQELPGRT